MISKISNRSNKITFIKTTLKSILELKKILRRIIKLDNAKNTNTILETIKMKMKVAFAVSQVKMNLWQAAINLQQTNLIKEEKVR